MNQATETLEQAHVLAEAMDQMNMEQLRVLNKEVVRRLNAKMRKEETTLSLQFNIGDRVSFTSNSKSDILIVGQIEKLNSKTAKVLTPTGKWNVSYRYLTKIEKEE